MKTSSKTRRKIDHGCQEDKKILIIVRDFLPHCPSLGDCMRVLKMAEYLYKNEYEVFILCAEGMMIDYYGYEDIIKNFKITYQPDTFQLKKNQLYLSDKRDDQSETSSRPLHKYLRRIRTLLSNYIIPDRGLFSIPKFVRSASKLIKEKRIQNILISTPLHSTQLVGIILKFKYAHSIRLIVDYRDSWNNTVLFQKKGYIANKISCWLESKILSSADRFTYVSSPILEKNLKRFPEARLEKKSTLVMNGFDLNYYVSSSRRELKTAPSIGLFGHVVVAPSSFNNPELFFGAIGQYSMRFKFIIYGNFIAPISFKKQHCGDIEYKGKVSHKEALSAMREMDLLLLLFSESKSADEVISGKLFEYMLSERPIIVLGSPTMEAARIVNQYKLGYTIDLFDATDIRSKMEIIWHDWANHCLPTYSIASIAEFSRQFQYSKLLNVLMEHERQDQSAKNKDNVYS